MEEDRVLEAFALAAVRQHAANSVTTRTFVPTPIEIGGAIVANPPSAPDDHPHLVLVGDAGAGKTELVRWISSERQRQYLRAERRRCPLLVDARSLAGATGLDDFAQRLSFQMRRFGAGISANGVAKAVDAGLLELFVDGIDEIPAMHERAALRHVADELKHRDVPVWITTRPIELSADPMWAVGHLPPLDRSQLVALLTQFLTQNESERVEDARRAAAEEAERLLNELDADTRAFLRTPLALMMFLDELRHRERRALTLTALYTDRVEGMLWRSASLRRAAGETSLTLSQILGTMERAAFAAFSKGASIVTLRDLEEAASAEVPVTAEVLDVLVNQSGLLTQVGAQGWAFVHKTFFEYFVARAIAARPRTEADDFVGLEDMVLVFLAGLLSDPSVVVERVVEERGFALLRACLREVSQGEANTRALVVNKIVGIAHGHYGDELLRALRKRRADDDETPAAETKSSRLLSPLWRGVRDPKPTWSSFQRGRQLERFALALFGTVFHVVEHGVDSALGQVDLLLENQLGGPFWTELGGDVPVECKNLAKAADLTHVNTFMSKVGPRLRLGFILSVSGFTAPAHRRLDLAVMESGALVVPISGDDVAKLIRDDQDPEEFFKRMIRRMRNLERF